jgi:mono/diheme cytochrome c family protein
MRYGPYAAAIAVAAALSALPLYAADDEVARGREIAIRVCASCHQVTATQDFPPDVPVPNGAVPTASFFDMAETRGDDPAYLRKMILSPHYPMPTREWSERDLKAIVAYIQSLR